MKRWLGLAALVFVATAGWRIGETLSPDALSMAVGILFGVLAGVPTALLVMAGSQRREAAERPRQPERSYPPRPDGMAYFPPPPPVIVVAPQALGPGGGGGGAAPGAPPWGGGRSRGGRGPPPPGTGSSRSSARRRSGCKSRDVGMGVNGGADDSAPFVIGGGLARVTDGCGLTAFDGFWRIPNERKNAL